ncbi:MAG: fatty acid hydroxylase [Cyanobium sp. CACIAM 14]|nr:MAG: fatty acid hydroxylase [Cyanobium sp. CACIAM 14]
MPNPFALFADPLTLTLLALYGGLSLWEALRPARPLPPVPHWRLRGLACFLIFLAVSTWLPLLWNDQLARWRLFDLTGLGSVGGALVGLLVYEAGVYAWHRAMHRSDLLWLWFHQWHHSAERLDVAGAFWFSPLDMLGWTVLASLALTLVVGITPQAVTAVVVGTTLLSLVQHANLRTPRWLGWWIQRPESHSRHHARGVHAGNYADLPLFDVLFGTFENPARFAEEAGFWPGASARVRAMLLGRDLAFPDTRTRPI